MGRASGLWSNPAQSRAISGIRLVGAFSWQVLKPSKGGACTVSLVTCSTAWPSSGGECFSLYLAWTEQVSACVRCFLSFHHSCESPYKHACKNVEEDTHPGEDFIYVLADTAGTDYMDTDTGLGRLWFLHFKCDLSLFLSGYNTNISPAPHYFHTISWTILVCSCS